MRVLFNETQAFETVSGLDPLPLSHYIYLSVVIASDEY